MPETRITGPTQTDRPIVDTRSNGRAQFLWSFATVVLLFVVVNPVLLIGVALALATVVTGWLGFRELLRRAERDDAESVESAATTQLRPVSASPREPNNVPAPTPWLHHRAA